MTRFGFDHLFPTPTMAGELRKRGGQADAGSKRGVGGAANSGKYPDEPSALGLEKTGRRAVFRPGDGRSCGVTWVVLAESKGERSSPARRTASFRKVTLPASWRLPSRCLAMPPSDSLSRFGNDDPWRGILCSVFRERGPGVCVWHGRIPEFCPLHNSRPSWERQGKEDVSILGPDSSPIIG